MAKPFCREHQRGRVRRIQLPSLTETEAIGAGYTAAVPTSAVRRFHASCTIGDRESPTDSAPSCNDPAR